MAVAVLVIAVCGGMAVGGASATGITPDENYHVVRLQSYLDEGRYVVPEEQSEGGTVADKAYVYAPVTTLILQAANVVVGNGSWTEVSDSTDAYHVRHLGIVVLGLLGVAAAGAVVGLLLGSWRWGIVGSAALLSFPTWTGHSMFNVKDIPVASGYTMMTAGLIACVLLCSGGASSRRLMAVTPLTMFGVLLMVGTRPGMWPAAVGSAVLALVALGLMRRLRLGTVALVIGPMVIAAVGLIALYPFLFADPHGWWTAATASSDSTATSSYGRLYVPAMIMVELPLAVLLAALIGSGGVVKDLVRRRPEAPWRPHVLCGVLVLAQAAALPAAAIVLGSPLSGGLRQLIFMLPAVAALAAVGMARLVGGTRHQWMAWSIVAVTLLLPAASQVTVYPYQYSWQNALADGAGLPLGRDYWRATFHEYVESMPTDGPVICAAHNDRGRLLPPSDGRLNDCRLDPLGPIASEWREQGRPVDSELPDGWFYAMFWSEGLPDLCVPLDEVTRWRHGRTVVLSHLALCKGGLEVDVRN